MTIVHHRPGSTESTAELARVMTIPPPAPPSWRDDALCREIDPDLWFPEKGESTREAKRMCGRCPVQAECLEYALAHDERFGVWGGLSERERRNLKRRPATAPAALAATGTEG